MEKQRGPGHPGRGAIKRAIDLACLALVSPCACTCALERRIGTGESIFALWAQLFAIVPGMPGVFLRRAFYRLTLDSCARNFFVGFGAIFSHRGAEVGEDAYIGPYAIVGSARLGRGCLLGSRSSVMSGGSLHVLDSDNRWSPADLTRLRQVNIGDYAWIGEASLIMADVGPSAMVAAGAVVSNRVPPAVVVAGNPARFVRHLVAQQDVEGHPDTGTVSRR
jgi:acetyltransferase-like isoleucine patch superfamily enzyme